MSGYIPVATAQEVRVAATLAHDKARELMRADRPQAAAVLDEFAAELEARLDEITESASTGDEVTE